MAERCVSRLETTSQSKPCKKSHRLKRSGVSRREVYQREDTNYVVCTAPRKCRRRIQQGESHRGPRRRERDTGVELYPNIVLTEPREPAANGPNAGSSADGGTLCDVRNTNAAPSTSQHVRRSRWCVGEIVLDSVRVGQRRPAPSHRENSTACGLLVSISPSSALKREPQLPFPECRLFSRVRSWPAHALVRWPACYQYLDSGGTQLGGTANIDPLAQSLIPEFSTPWREDADGESMCWFSPGLAPPFCK